MNAKHALFRTLPLTLAVASCITAAQAKDFHIADSLTQTAIKPNLEIIDRVTLPPMCNPPLNSVRAAHGNTDWHIDTAHEFLFGEEMDGTASAANHVPNSWSREHIHVDMTHTSDYYEDSTVVGTGEDTDSDHGIDQSMLFFYAGHGSPTSWSTLGGHGSQNDMLLGNCDNGSKLRYYWQCSCKVFAHGPDSCAGSSETYGCPQDFDGSSDSYSMRNVFERWGPALDADLRMACGASTLAYCHETQTNRIWDNYNNKGFDVADSFIFGLKSAGYDKDVVPLCITTGGWSTSATPLYDTSFSNLPNPSGSFYHIQYLSSFDDTVPDIVLPKIPRYIPRFPLIRPELPDLEMYKKLVMEDDWMVSPEDVGPGPKVRVNTRSNAIYVKQGITEPPSDTQLSKKEYIAHAMQQLEELALYERDMGEPEVSRLMIQTVPRDGQKGEIVETQKNVLVSFPRIVDVEGTPVKVLGEGGKIHVQLNNDGSPILANKVWRDLSPKAGMVPVKPMEEAYEEALKELGDGSGYELAQTEFGYKAESGNQAQEMMTAVYQFVFKPAKGADETLPPRMIEIPAI